jgi:uncharacterized protein YifE (UPF0438 family)
MALTILNVLKTVKINSQISLLSHHQKQLKYKVATSFDSKKYFQCYQTSHHQTRVLCEAEILTQESQKLGALDKSDNTPPQTPTQQQQALTLNRSQSEPGEEFDEDEEETSMVPDNQTLLRMLEENEKVRE